MIRCLVHALIAVALLVPGAGRAQEAVARAADPAVGRVLNLTAASKLRGTGSGFVLGAVDGGKTILFLTNNHVIQGASKLAIGFLQGEKIYIYAAKIVADDPVRDLTVLAFNAPGTDPDMAEHRLVALPIRNVAARRGEEVAALGFPGSSDNLGTSANDRDFYNSTITNGNASKILNQSWGNGGAPFEIVQHTAAINPGNSGGPLLDYCAQVVGLNTMVALDGKRGGNANDTYFASSSTTIIGFLEAQNLPFLAGERECTSGEGPEPAASEIAPPPVSVRSVPTWLIAALCLALALAVIGGIIALSRRRGSVVAPPRADAPVLILRVGAGSARPVTAAELSRGLRIGRAPEADIRVDGAGMSRVHALIRLDGRVLTLTDLGSTNGTRVDGRVLKPNVPVQIASRSKILLGSEPFRISRPEKTG